MAKRALSAFLLGLSLFFWTPFAARADDAADAQAVIRAQAEAFQRDDAEAAFALAAPAIREQFGPADKFMAMVRGNYAAVFRHKSLSFGENRSMGAQTLQEVRIVDADGVPWAALYTLEKRGDGTFGITGCILKAIGEPA